MWLRVYGRQAAKTRVAVCQINLCVRTPHTPRLTQLNVLPATSAQKMAYAYSPKGISWRGQQRPFPSTVVGPLWLKDFFLLIFWNTDVWFSFVDLFESQERIYICVLKSIFTGIIYAFENLWRNMTPWTSLFAAQLCFRVVIEQLKQWNPRKSSCFHKPPREKGCGESN